MITFTYYLRLTFLFTGLFLIFGNVNAKDEGSLNLYVVNYPLKFFAESIAGESVTVTLPMPNDIDPAFWSPKAEDVLALQKADLILLNGANYAKWLPKVSLPLSKLINTSSEFRDDYIKLELDVKHNHGAGGEHSHAGTAFTTWLDFSMAERQAKAVFNVITTKRPNLKNKLEGNFNKLQQSLVGFNKQLSQIGESLNGQAILGSHPVYQYLKKRYQLNLRSVHWEPEDAPTEEQWSEFKKILESHPAKWMLWEGEPAIETVKKLETLGVKSIVFSPCANAPKGGDFLSVMEANISRLKNIKK